MTYELMPFDVNAPALDAVLSVVRDAGAANGRIALDTWHLGKMGITPEDLRAVPPEALGYVELSDGPARDMPDLDEETTRFRRLPGEGDFDIAGYVRVANDLGYRGPWGVEVLSDELRALPLPKCSPRRTARQRGIYRPEPPLGADAARTHGRRRAKSPSPTG